MIFLPEKRQSLAREMEQIKNYFCDGDYPGLD